MVFKASWWHNPILWMSAVFGFFLVWVGVARDSTLLCFGVPLLVWSGSVPLLYRIRLDSGYLESRGWFGTRRVKLHQISTIQRNGGGPFVLEFQGQSEVVRINFKWYSKECLLAVREACKSAQGRDPFSEFEMR
jgi:hypothetical protein